MPSSTGLSIHFIMASVVPLRLPSQAYAAWPAERLDEIGGSTAFYAQVDTF